MPTILRRDGFRFVIWPNDHLPPHVHVFKAGNEVIINLGIDGMPFVRSNRGMSRSEQNNALLITALNNNVFLELWEEIHGKAIND